MCGFFLMPVTYSQSESSQTKELELWDTGTPLITSYLPEDYRADPQNWSFAQSDNGIIYTGNSSGVLEYDGNVWRLIKLSNEGVVRSLAKDRQGRIYVGGSKEFGYLKPNKIGKMEFISLLSNLSSEYHDFTDIWSIRIIKDSVYFICGKYIFILRNGKIKIIPASHVFGRDTVFNQKLLILDGKRGLKFLEDDILVDAPGSELIKANPVLLSYDQENLLVLDRFDGGFLFDFNKLTPIKNNNKVILNGKFPYDAIKLHNGNMLVATLGFGVFILDENGKIKTQITKRKGLLSNVIYSAFIDHDENVWLGTANGINIIKTVSPLRMFGEPFNLDEGVFATIIHKNKLYAGCHNGLFSFNLDSISNKEQIFQKSEGAIEIPRSLVASGDDLFVGDLNGIYRLRNNKIVQFIRPNGNTTGYKLIESLIQRHIMYVANDQGHFYKLIKNEGNWNLSDTILNVNDRIHHLLEDDKGAVWLATNADGIYKIEGLDKSAQCQSKPNFNIVHYDIQKGLPELFENSIAFFNGTIYSGTSQGLYKFNEVSDTFIPDTLLNAYYSKRNYSCGLISSGSDGSLWIPTFSNYENRIFKLSGKAAIKELSSFRRANLNQVLNINPGSSSITYLSTPNGIVVHKSKMEQIKRVIPRVNIRNITVNKDSTIFAGRTDSGNIDHELRYELNDLRIQYAMASFDDVARNQYQSQLLGYDKDWSSWKNETQKDYTNIPEGDYTFKVRAKNIFGEISNEDSYSFIILPPWYRTWFAYFFYIVMGMLVVWLFTRWRSHQLRSENLALEALVDERTKEISQKNKLLQHQAVKLKEMDTMKTRLFANISHEFRTPLTLIKGPIEKLEEAQENKISTLNIKMIRRNSNRLLNLVNQLLDLSKLDSGKLNLNKAEGDVFKCIRAAASAYSSHAVSRQMDYQIKIPSDLLWAEFDRDKLEKIVYNLLSNAFKFTSDEGRVIIDAAFHSGRLGLKISDTGSGIPAEKLPYIFDRFFQVDDSYTKEKAGSGIGLALTKELVELLGGNIYVESEKGRGTLFLVVIPLEEIQAGHMKVSVDRPIATVGNVLDQPLQKKSGEKEIKVLVIEDNNDMRHFIKEQLEESYEVLEAINGKAGLKAAQKWNPELIITDLMMPQMDGITLCKKLKTNLTTSHIPVVMLTAKAGIENKLEGLETGADDYLIKPFNARELQLRCKNLIEQRQNLRELFSKNISLNPGEITVNSLDEKFLHQVLSFLEEHYHDSSFGVPEMQKGLGMSKTYLHKKIKALTNHPPGELLRNFRLKRAAQLLVQKGDNISQTAYDVGFNSLSYFTRCFKEYYGIAPTAYIQKHKLK